MLYPVSTLLGKGSELTALAEKMSLLANEANAIDSSISRCYGAGGVAGRAGSAAGNMYSQANRVSHLGSVAVSASSRYTAAEENISASAFGLLGGTDTGFHQGAVIASAATALSGATVLGAVTSASGASGSGSDGANGSQLTTLSRSTVSVSPGDEASDIAKSAKDAAIDNYRERTGKAGKTEKYDNYVHSSSNSDVISVLDVDIRYVRYTDYTGVSFEETEGDGFYSVDGSLTRDCIHIDYETLDGSGLNGNIVLNGMKLYGDGEFDLARGNAYLKGGADYTVASFTTGVDREYGGFSLTGEVGAGAHIDAGIHDGKLTVDVGAAFGIGVGVKFEIDYEGIWETTCDMFGF